MICKSFVVAVALYVCAMATLVLPRMADGFPTGHSYSKRYGHHDTRHNDMDRALRIARGSKHAAHMSRLIQLNHNKIKATATRQQKSRRYGQGQAQRMRSTANRRNKSTSGY